MGTERPAVALAEDRLSATVGVGNSIPGCAGFPPLVAW
jgi:hypothetical protein